LEALKQAGSNPGMRVPSINLNWADSHSKQDRLNKASHGALVYASLRGKGHGCALLLCLWRDTGIGVLMNLDGLTGAGKQGLTLPFSRRHWNKRWLTLSVVNNVSQRKRTPYYYDIEKPDYWFVISRLVVGRGFSWHIVRYRVTFRCAPSKPALDHDNHGYFGFMYVAEEYRGLGLNKVILQDLVSWGQQRGVYRFLSFEVYAENNSLFPCYEKFGFRGSSARI